MPEGAPLEILLLGPSGQVERVTQVVAMFNQPMTALGDYDNVPEGAMKLDPPQEGDFKWLNQYSLAFIPKSPLEGSAEFSATVAPGLKALSGAVLAEGKSVNIALPRLEAVNWSRTAYLALSEDEALQPAWRVLFNQKIDLESVAGKAFFTFARNGETVKLPAAAREDTEDYYSDYRGFSLIFAPKEKLPKNVDYQLVLEPGIRSLAGPLPSGRILVTSAETFGPFQARLDSYYTDGADRADPAYDLCVYFSNPVKLSAAARALKVDNGYDTTALLERYPEKPAPREGEENADEYGTYLYLPGGFNSETTYTISVDENLADVYGQKTGQNAALAFSVGSYPTSIRLDNAFGLMETATEPKIPIVLSNIAKVPLMGYALTAPEALAFFSQLKGGGPDFYAGYYEATRKTIAQKPKILDIIAPEGSTVNGPRILPVDLEALFGEKLKSHVLLMEALWRDPQSETPGSTHALMQVSDIGLAIKTASDGGLIWTTDLARGRSWPGVALEIYASNGQLVWQGQSDEEGLARLPGARELLAESGGDSNLYVVGRAEGQMSIWNIRWNDGLEPWRWNLSGAGDPMSASPERRFFLLSALPLYKPGETAEFKLIAREKDGENLRDMAGRDLLIQIYDGRGELFQETRSAANDYGTLSHSFEIPQDASLGSWDVYVSSADGGSGMYAGAFKVMTYRAPAFEIRLSDMPRKAVAGMEVALDIEAVYHFGAPVTAQPASYEITAGPVYSFSLPGLSDYNFINNFADADEYDDSGYGYQEPTVTVASDETQVDAKGRLAVQLSLTPPPDARPRPRQYTANFSVTDVDQRVVSNRASFMAHPAEEYVGLKTEKFLGRGGEPFTIKAVVADLDGNPASGRAIKARLYRREWQNVRRKTVGNAYEYVSRVVDVEAGALESKSGAAPVDLTFTPDAPGYYWVLAEIKDAKGRANQSSESFYVTGDGPVGWRMTNDDRLTLIADKKEYRPGDTAKIMVQSPFAEGEGLVTVERAGVREARVFKIENQSPTLEIPIGEEDRPNVYVSVLLARGRIADKPDENGVDLGKPAIRMGYIELKAPGDQDLLTVEVTPSKKETGPGGEVEVTIAVKDNEGRPVSEAEAALIAADAAVLQLAGDEGYYPHRYFQQDEPLMVTTANNLISLMGRRHWNLKGANPGGGGADLASALLGGDDARRLFKALAYFNPRLTLDSEGKAAAAIKMPENLTTFKFYAVATGRGKKSGTGTSEVLVTKNLLVRSALPGYAGAGDNFAAAMVATNRSQNAGEVKVALSGDNFTLAEGETAEKTVNIEPGQSLEVPFRVKTENAGQARFLFSVNMGAESDAAEYRLNVVPPNKLVSQASYEQLTPGETRVDLALPQGSDPERGGLALTISPTLLGTLNVPFQYLTEYQHYCIEQQTSMAWGSLLAIDLRDRLANGQDEAKLKAAGEHVRAHLNNLTKWNQEGGFNFWPSGREYGNRSVYLTAYILEFILSARQQGFQANEGMLDEMREFLLSSLNSNYEWPHRYSEEAKEESRSYAAAALSRAGVNVAPYLENVYQKRDALSLIQLTNLIRAIGHQPKGTGQAEQLRALLALLNNHISQTAGEAQFANNNPGAPEIWASPARNAARALETLCLVAPHNVLTAPLMRNLMTQTKKYGGHFGNPHTNVAGLLAISAYVKALEPVAPNLKIEAIMGGAKLLEAVMQSFAAPPISAEISASVITAEAAPLLYKTEGEGQAWVSSTIKFAPLLPDLSANTSGGFMLSRSFKVMSPAESREGMEQFKRGDVVRVTVTMMVPQKRYSVVMEDRVPAGFEPINFNLADADMTLLNLAAEKNGYWYNHQEIREDRVSVYADQLTPGVYTFSYLARAVTPGLYSTPGPTAEEMYAPETFGRGQGLLVTVE